MSISKFSKKVITLLAGAALFAGAVTITNNVNKPVTVQAAKKHKKYYTIKNAKKHFKIDTVGWNGHGILAARTHGDDESGVNLHVSSNGKLSNGQKVKVTVPKSYIKNKYKHYKGTRTYTVTTKGLYSTKVNNLPESEKLINEVVKTSADSSDKYTIYGTYAFSYDYLDDETKNGSKRVPVNYTSEDYIEGDYLPSPSVYMLYKVDDGDGIMYELHGFSNVKNKNGILNIGSKFAAGEPNNDYEWQEYDDSSLSNMRAKIKRSGGFELK